MKVYACAQSEQNYSAINLSNGDMADFNDVDKVIPVQCEINCKIILDKPKLICYNT